MKESKGLLIFMLAVGVFGILNTEMGVVGILPDLAEHFNVSVSTAGWLVSGFALAVAVAGPTLPLVFSSINRKKIMILVLVIFIIGNIVSVFTENFTIALFARIIPGLFHPVYVSMALSVAAELLVHTFQKSIEKGEFQSISHDLTKLIGEYSTKKAIVSMIE